MNCRHSIWNNRVDRLESKTVPKYWKLGTQSNGSAIEVMEPESSTSFHVRLKLHSQAQKNYNHQLHFELLKGDIPLDPQNGHYLCVPEKGPLPLGSWKGPITFGFLERAHYLWVPEKGPLPLGSSKGAITFGSWKGLMTFGFLERAHYLWVPEKGPLPLGSWKGPITFGSLERARYLWGPEKGPLPLGSWKGPTTFGSWKGPIAIRSWKGPITFGSLKKGHTHIRGVWWWRWHLRDGHSSC